MEDISTSIIMPSFQGLQNSTTTNDIITTAINNANVDFEIYSRCESIQICFIKILKLNNDFFIFFSYLRF